MHEVQALIRLALPDTAARTLWMFGFQRRLVFFLDQGTLWPKPGPLPHTSHTAATGVTPTSVPRNEEQGRSSPVQATEQAYPTTPERGESRGRPGRLAVPCLYGGGVAPRSAPAVVRQPPADEATRPADAA